MLWVPSWSDPLTDLTAATWLLVIVSLVVAGWVCLGRPAQRGNGTLMLIIAVTAAARHPPAALGGTRRDATSAGQTVTA